MSSSVVVMTREAAVASLGQNHVDEFLRQIYVGQFQRTPSNRPLPKSRGRPTKVRQSWTHPKVSATLIDQAAIVREPSQSNGSQFTRQAIGECPKNGAIFGNRPVGQSAQSRAVLADRSERVTEEAKADSSPCSLPPNSMVMSSGESAPLSRTIERALPSTKSRRPSLSKVNSPTQRYDPTHRCHRFEIHTQVEPPLGSVD